MCTADAQMSTDQFIQIHVKNLSIMIYPKLDVLLNAPNIFIKKQQKTDS